MALKCQKPAQKRSQSRLSCILNSAASLFEAQGVVGVSPGDIALSANITRTSLYRYFTNKVEIVAALAEKQLALLQRLIRPPRSTCVLADVEGLLDNHIEVVRKAPNYYMVWHGVMSIPALNDFYVKKQLWLSSVWEKVLNNHLKHCTQQERDLLATSLPLMVEAALQDYKKCSKPERQTLELMLKSRVKAFLGLPLLFESAVG